MANGKDKSQDVTQEQIERIERRFKEQNPPSDQEIKNPNEATRGLSSKSSNKKAQDGGVTVDSKGNIQGIKERKNVQDALDHEKQNNTLKQVIAKNDPNIEKFRENIERFSPDNDISDVNLEDTEEPETQEEALKRGKEYIEQLRKQDEELANKEIERAQQKDENGRFLLSPEQRDQIQKAPLEVFGGSMADFAADVGNFGIAIGKGVEDLASEMGMGDGETFQRFVNENLKGGKFDGDRLIEEPEEPSSNLMRSVLSEVAPFFGLSKAASATRFGKRAGKLGNYSIGAIGDASLEAMLYDPEEERLSQLAQKVPALAPWIPQFMTSDEGSELEQRALAGMEALVLDSALAGGFEFGKKVPGLVKDTTSNLMKFYKKRRKFFDSRKLRSGTPGASQKNAARKTKNTSSTQETQQPTDPETTGGEQPTQADASTQQSQEGTSLNQTETTDSSEFDTPKISETSPANKTEQEAVDVATKPKKKRIRVRPSTGERVDTQSKMEAGEEAKKALDYVTSKNLTEKTAKEARDLFDQGDIKAAFKKLFGDAEDLSDDEIASGVSKIMNRGRVSDEATARNAEEILKNSSKDLEEFLNRDIGDVLNSDEVKAYKNYIAGSVREMKDLIPPGGPAQMTGAEKAAFKQGLQKLNMHIQRFKAFGSEGGRALRQFNDLSNNAKITQIPEIVDEYIKINGGEASLDNIIEMFEKIGDSGGDPTKAVFEAAKQDSTSKAAEVLNGYILSNFLASFATNTSVVTGTASKVIANTLAEGTAGAVHFLRGKGTDKFHDAFAAYKGSIEGLLPALGKASKFSVGRSKGASDVGYKFGGKNGFYKELIRSAIDENNIKQSGMLGWTNLVELAGNTLDPVGRLQVMDTFLSNVAKSSSMQKHAVRTALRNGLTPGTKKYNESVNNLLKNPTTRMMNEAKKSSKDLTFTKDFKDIPILGSEDLNIGQFFEFFDEKLLRRFPGAALWSGFLRIMVNMADTTIRHVPGIKRLNPKVRETLSNGTDQELSEEAARSIVGAGLIGTGAYLNSEGLLTGSNPAGRETSEAITGSRRYDEHVIYVGEKGDFVKYEKAFDPFASLVSLGADLNEMFSYARNRAEEEEFFDLSKRLIRVAGNTVTPSHAFQAIGDMYEIVSGQKKVSENISPTGVIPLGALVGDIRETGIPGIVEGDKTDRVTRVDKKMNDFEQITQNLINNFKEKIPGLSSTLPPKLNYAGEKIDLPPGLGNEMISPTKTNGDWHKDPVNRELLRLRMSAPITNPPDDSTQEEIKITMPSRVVNLGKLANVPPDLRGSDEVFEYELGPWEYHNYVKLQAGRPEEIQDKVKQAIKENDKKNGTNNWEKLKSIPNLKKKLNEVINSKKYKEANDQFKKILINKTIKENRLDAAEFLPFIAKHDLNNRIQEINDAIDRRRQKVFEAGESEDAPTDANGLSIDF